MPPDLSIIVPVFNEQALINGTVDHLQRLAFNGRRQIIVVDGAADAGTIAAICRPGAICATSVKGRAIQMNTGAAIAAGRILLFAHADTRLPARALPLVMDAIDRQGAKAGASALAIAAPGPAFRLIEAVANARSRLLKLPYGDQAIFIARDLFESLNGFKPIALMEDVDLMYRLRQAGTPISVLRHKVATSARRWKKEGIVYATLRNWTLLLLFSCGVNPQRLAPWYR